jgi:oligoribonuclease NrnB/cAMP/cGMP phosphodiesterase (DHH superfamily)
MIGAIGDYDLSASQDLVDECKESYPHLIGKDPHNSELSKGSKLIGGAITLKNWRGAKEVLEALVNADSYDDFADVEKFRGYKKDVDKEFKRVLREAKKENIPKCNLIIYTIDSELSMVSNASNHLSTKYPDKIIIVRKKSMTEWKLSARFQNGKINLGKIIKKAVSDIGTGGGHPKAAAGMVSDWDKFKEKFISQLKNIKE